MSKVVFNSEENTPTATPTPTALTFSKIWSKNTGTSFMAARLPWPTKMEQTTHIDALGAQRLFYRCLYTLYTSYIKKRALSLNQYCRKHFIAFYMLSLQRSTCLINSTLTKPKISSQNNIKRNSKGSICWNKLVSHYCKSSFVPTNDWIYNWCLVLLMLHYIFLNVSQRSS